jgi:hypothetical protein
MSKYDPLGHFLTKARDDEVPMTFAELEKLLGFALPPRAQKIRAWWSNNPDNNVMTKVWLAAGFHTERVDIRSRRLVFRRVRRFRPPHGASSGVEAAVSPGELKPRRHPGFGLMKGLTTIAPGTDLTAPTGHAWGGSE